MADIDKVIQKFVKARVGGVIVIDSKGTIIYEDGRIILSDKARESFLGRRPVFGKKGKTWELTDYDSGKYYRIETATVESENEQYQCHHFTDVSDYAGLFQDISDYSRQIADISTFQSNIMTKLSKPFEECLENLTDFCGSDGAVMYLERGNGRVLKVSYDGTYEKETLNSADDTSGMLSARRFDMVDGYFCFLGDMLGDSRCSVFLLRGDDFNEDYFRDASVYNVVRLYIENALLREKIVYSSEHDMLTGLFNKGKYMVLKDAGFGNPEHITIFNMDVNNLKVTNDNEGHEAGDRLIIRAADSIHAVTGDRIWGFRTGGDEFMIIATDLDEEGARGLYDEWRKALRKINENSDEKCVVACGYVHGTGDYDLDNLLAEADALMYDNKRSIKDGRTIA